MNMTAASKSISIKRADASHVAAQSGTDIRSVFRYVQGLPGKASITERIEAALDARGLAHLRQGAAALPPPPSGVIVVGADGRYTRDGEPFDLVGQYGGGPATPEEKRLASLMAGAANARRAAQAAEHAAAFARRTAEAAQKLIASFKRTARNSATPIARARAARSTRSKRSPSQRKARSDGEDGPEPDPDLDPAGRSA